MLVLKDRKVGINAIALRQIWRASGICAMAGSPMRGSMPSNRMMCSISWNDQHCPMTSLYRSSIQWRPSQSMPKALDSSSATTSAGF